MHTIARVAVLGAGTMGARLADLYAKAGVAVLLLDLTKPPDQADSSIETAGFEEGLSLLRGCDWVIEAVVEDLAIKRDLWGRVGPILSTDAIASTNTSGLSIGAIAEALPTRCRKQFMGVHFFNPPAKLRLVELIGTPQTTPETFLAATSFLTERLSKVIVKARDTPNFIANRIGAYFSAKAQSLGLAGRWTVEEVDFMTGPLIGMPRSGTYRLMDVIGLDVWVRVLETLDFEVQPYLREMLRRGWLGTKAGGGFYRNQEALDLRTLEYRPALPVSFAAGTVPALRDSFSGDGRTAAFLSPLLSGLIAYSHEVAPLIANSPSDLDLAMRWGYGWTLGPFEMEAALL